MSDSLSDNPRVIRVSKDEEQWDGLVQVAVEIIQHGGLVVLPTDTVYGIACDPFNASAVDALFKAKGRGRDLPLPILVHAWRQALGLVEAVTEHAETLFAHYWPGPLTVVLKESPGLGWDLGASRGTVALRMPKQDFTLKVIERTGPLAVTSANRSGEPTPGKIDEVVAQLGDHVEAYFDDGWRMGRMPSTIIDLTGPTPRVLREGAIPASDIESVLEVPIFDYFQEEEPEGEFAEVEDEDRDEELPQEPEPFYPEADDPAAKIEELKAKGKLRDQRQAANAPSEEPAGKPAGNGATPGPGPGPDDR